MKNFAHADVDMQFGFTTECPKELPVQETLEVAAATVAVRQKFREAGELVLRSGDFHLNNVEYAPWPPHCEQNTFGAQFVDPNIDPQDVILAKGFQYDHPFSLMAGHTLREKKNGWIKMNDKLWVPDKSTYQILDENDIDTVVGTGVAGEYCVHQTLQDVVQTGRKVYAVKDAIAFFDPAKKTEFYEKWQDLGIILVTSDQVENILAQK